jgi:hypothetical protein
MSEATMTKHEDVGILGMIKKTPPHYLFGVMLFALLWLVSKYFVSQEQYDKDQVRVAATLNEIRQDIKEILKHSK